MGKVILEIPNIPNATIKAHNIYEAMQKMSKLNYSRKHKNNALQNIKTFKGIGQFDAPIKKDEWYYQ